LAGYRIDVPRPYVCSALVLYRWNRWGWTGCLRVTLLDFGVALVAVFGGRDML